VEEKKNGQWKLFFSPTDSPIPLPLPPFDIKKYSNSQLVRFRNIIFPIEKARSFIQVESFGIIIDIQEYYRNNGSFKIIFQTS